MINAYADEKKGNKEKQGRAPRMATLTLMKHASWYIGSDTAIRRLHNDISNAVNG